jgi:glycosyltransferase involved in cell wall biosynthesis
MRQRPSRQDACKAACVAGSAPPLDASVVICTYNRADRLAETLDTLAHSRLSGLRWNVIVVDNNSNDATREVVTSRTGTFPVGLQYIFEPHQGKSIALNTGLTATDAAIIVFTDDDVRVGEGWVDASCRSLLDNPRIDYTGGPVLPIWERPCPPWFDQERADLWGTLAILDYGPDPFVFEERRRVPLGVNMAVRRSLIDRIGGFDPGLGRRGDSLIGQEQAEFFCRSRNAGAVGLYVPEMALHHHVPARRLTRDYFRRWWYWKGVSKARLEQRHPLTETGVDLTSVAKILGVPRFMIGSALRDLARWVSATIVWNAMERARREMMLCYFAGYVKGVRVVVRDDRAPFTRRRLDNTKPRRSMRRSSIL